MSSFDLTSPVVRELRAARPVAPESLRERVAARTRPEPEARFSLPSWHSVRRVALVAVPACLAIAIGVPLIDGLVNSGSSPTVEASRPATYTTQAGYGTDRGNVAPHRARVAPTTTVPTWDGAVTQRVEELRAAGTPQARAK